MGIAVSTSSELEGRASARRSAVAKAARRGSNLGDAPGAGATTNRLPGPRRRAYTPDQFRRRCRAGAAGETGIGPLCTDRQAEVGFMRSSGGLDEREVHKGYLERPHNDYLAPLSKSTGHVKHPSTQELARTQVRRREGGATDLRVRGGRKLK